MSEKMYPIPFDRLMHWALEEYKREGTVFGVRRLYQADPDKTLPIFGERIETPFGPAAGPNSQLAQNLIAAYVAGARFFELKTVQKMDGEELARCVPRPCILAEDEGYNQEWSTELTVEQARDEYIKAWCALKVLSGLWGLGDPNGFVFNMSVGYDLEGIRGPKVDGFIEAMKDASHTAQFAECRRVLKALLPGHESWIDAISPRVSRSVTLSTLHGCPPEEIERIASYLITEKGLHTFVKCNPTILGYRTARDTLNQMGYDYVVFDEHHFNEDLQWADAVPMFERLRKLAGEKGLEFGLKLSNTFPVDTTRGELPNDEMYMSGRALFPLTIEMCSRFSRQFGGSLRLSYAGGADWFNCDKLFSAGIWPITVATTILKPGGYNRLAQLCEKTEALPFAPFTGTDTAAIAALSGACRFDPRHVKPVKPLPSRKSEEPVPWFNCFSAPCEGGCPIRQDIPEYLALCEQGRYEEALRLIVEKNPLPFITGTICAHRCMTKCSRGFYEDPVHIRAVKLLAAERGCDALLRSIRRPAPVPGKRVAIVGGGPTGMAAAFFLSRAGIACTVFEREAKLGGIVRQVIPGFRIPEEAIDNDAILIAAYGAEIRTNTEAPTVEALKAQGYTHVFYAVGAWKPGRLELPGAVKPVIPWMKARKSGADQTVLGNVAVIGGGNTAMDAARLAVREGASSVTLVYRRTKRYMPADARELELAMADGVCFLELAAPVKQEGGTLICERMQLGRPDASGRRSPVPTGELLEIPCDLVISAVGEQVDPAPFTASGIALDAKGRPAFRTNLENVYAGGDALRGPATVVEGIADAARFAEAVIGESHSFRLPEAARITLGEAAARKGVLAPAGGAEREGRRCLHCNTLCENCVDVCPNRANVPVTLPDGSVQILHLDALCNECGNCTAFCPYASQPCRDKLTLFHTAEAFADSANCGFCFLPESRVRVRLQDGVRDLDASGLATLPEMLGEMIETVRDRYPWLRTDTTL